MEPDRDDLSAEPGDGQPGDAWRRSLAACWHRPGRSIQAMFGTRIRMTPLPGVLTGALRLVDDLAR